MFGVNGLNIGNIEAIDNLLEFKTNKDFRYQQFDDGDPNGQSMTAFEICELHYMDNGVQKLSEFFTCK